MGFSTYNGDTSVIADLDDRPNDTGGLDAAALKAKFDEAVTSLAAWINSADEANAGGLLGQLAAGTAAGNLGFASDASEAVGQGQTTLFNAAIFEDVTTVKGALIALAKAIYQIGEQTVADDSLETVKYKNGSVTADKLAENAVATAKLAALAVTTAKLADLAVTAAKIANGAVGTDQLAAGAVTSAKLGAGAAAANINAGTKVLNGSALKDGEVTNAKLAGSIPYSKLSLGSGDIPLAKVADAQGKHVKAEIAISVANWGGGTTVTKSGLDEAIKANATVLVAPAPASAKTWRDCGVYCSAQGSKSLTFKCDTTPTAAITVYAVVLP